MDHETREVLGNIIGLLEIMKKDIKIIKQDMYTLNNRQEGSNQLPRALEESVQPIKAIDPNNSNSSTVWDQLKISRLK